MEKNYWLTTHWPPHEKEKIAERVCLKNGKESAGKDLKEGDEVLVYQTKQGDKEIWQYSDGSEEVLKRRPGKMGIIAICEAQSKLIDHKDSKPTKYEKGKEIWWRYQSPLKVISKSGFVEKKQAEKILGYHINRSFVKKHSGLKQITTDQFKALCKAFCQGTNNTQSQKHQLRPHIAPRGEESEDHKRLKEYVAASAEDVFQEERIKYIDTEYIFPTNDKADILLEDKYGRIIGVEVEISVDKDNISGILQAIKYRYMAEVVRDKSPGDSRAVLIAYEISNDIFELCKSYNVECIKVAEDKVKQWASKT